MIRYEELGFQSFDEYIYYFFTTLMPSNKTFEYFVDWEKVKKTINSHIYEISLLNSLTQFKIDEIYLKLKELLLSYPETVEVIPILLAERIKNNKIDIFDPDLEEFLVFDFSKESVNKLTVDNIINFCDKVGILNLISEIKNLADYLLGVEVGLDTNARKNRSGQIFEKLVQRKVYNLIEKKYEIIFNDPNFSLYPLITGQKRPAKTHDIVIYEGNIPKLIVECNFYNSTGSKPASISESYPEMYKISKENNIKFVWVTDGPAWLRMREPLIRAMKNMEWILNFNLLKNINNILKFEENIY